MNYLTESHIEFISNEISKSINLSSELKEDLIDHFCCLIEDEIRKGKSFQAAYNKAYNNICPNGFDEIQRETIFLLNEKKIKIMKKSLYLFGFLTSIGFTTSILFKFQHWPYGSLLLLVSTLILIFCLLPLLFINLYKQEISKISSDKIKHILGYLGFALLSAGLVFKFNHWPAANILIVISVVVLNFGFFPLLFFKMYKKSVE